MDEEPTHQEGPSREERPARLGTRPGAQAHPALVMFSDQDPVTGPAARHMRRLIPTAKDEPEFTVPNGGHFLQEDQPGVIVEQITAFVERRPIG